MGRKPYRTRNLIKAAAAPSLTVSREELNTWLDRKGAVRTLVTKGISYGEAWRRFIEDQVLEGNGAMPSLQAAERAYRQFDIAHPKLGRMLPIPTASEIEFQGQVSFGKDVAICYIGSMNSMSLRIDNDLIREARISGHLFHRSIAQQVEHWAVLGRTLELVLTVPAVARIKGRSADLGKALAGAHSPSGRKRALVLLARKKGPLYGTKPERPGILLQYKPDHSPVAGEMIDGQFVRMRQAAKNTAR